MSNRLTPVTSSSGFIFALNMLAYAQSTDALRRGLHAASACRRSRSYCEWRGGRAP